MRDKLLMEAAIVGASTAAIGFALSKVMKPDNLAFWFALGAATHVGWELTGGNRWYVENRNAKDFPKGLIGSVR